MNEEQVRKILGDMVQPDNRLHSLAEYVAWPAYSDKVTLDAEFSADQLEAIAWWMRNMKVTS